MSQQPPKRKNDPRQTRLPFAPPQKELPKRPAAVQVDCRPNRARLVTKVGGQCGRELLHKFQYCIFEYHVLFYAHPPQEKLDAFFRTNSEKRRDVDHIEEYEWEEGDKTSTAAKKSRRPAKLCALQLVGVPRAPRSSHSGRGAPSGSSSSEEDVFHRRRSQKESLSSSSGKRRRSALPSSSEEEDGEDNGMVDVPAEGRRRSARADEQRRRSQDKVARSFVKARDRAGSGSDASYEEESGSERSANEEESDDFDGPRQKSVAERRIKVGGSGDGSGWGAYDASRGKRFRETTNSNERRRSSISAFMSKVSEPRA